MWCCLLQVVVSHWYFVNVPTSQQVQKLLPATNNLTWVIPFHYVLLMDLWLAPWLTLPNTPECHLSPRVSVNKSRKLNLSGWDDLWAASARLSSSTRVTFSVSKPTTVLLSTCVSLPPPSEAAQVLPSSNLQCIFLLLCQLNIYPSISHSLNSNQL